MIKRTLGYCKAITSMIKRIHIKVLSETWTSMMIEIIFVQSSQKRETINGRPNFWIPTKCELPIVEKQIFKLWEQIERETIRWHMVIYH